MRKIIIASCGVLALVIIVFSINYTVRLDDREVEINGTTYALTIDGDVVDSIPTSGNYYLANYTCENDSIVTWDYMEHDLYIEGTSANEDKCTLDFNTGYPKLNTMKVGDYVAYVGDSANGCFNGGAGKTGTDDAKSGNSCKGENANQPAGGADTSYGTYGYCNSSDYSYFVYGWRIAYIEEGKVHLVSAGSPECRKVSTNVNTLITDLNTAALAYCNSEYVDGGECVTTLPSSNAWAMGNSDFEKITNALFGTSNSLTTVYNSSNYCFTRKYLTCGYGNNLIDNGGYYWFAAHNTDNNGVRWNPISRGVYSATVTIVHGLRPIIALSPSVYVTGGTGTMDDPYTIGN